MTTRHHPGGTLCPNPQAEAIEVLVPAVLDPAEDAARERANVQCEQQAHEAGVVHHRERTREILASYPRPDRCAAELARAYAPRTVLIAAGVWVGSMSVVGVACYRWGHVDAAADIQATTEGLVLALWDGPQAASDRLTLMRFNDIQKALAVCTGGRSVPEASGRRACSVPLWLEPAKLVPSRSPIRSRPSWGR